MTDKHFTPNPASFCLLDERQCCPRSQFVDSASHELADSASHELADSAARKLLARRNKNYAFFFSMSTSFFACSKPESRSSASGGAVKFNCTHERAQHRQPGREVEGIWGTQGGDGEEHTKLVKIKKPLNTAQSTGHEYSRYLSQLFSRHRPPRLSPRASSCQPEAEYSGPSQPSRQQLRQPFRRSTP
jgi:hypothetical protein